MVTRNSAFLRFPRSTLLALFALTSGCASYHPKPLDIAETATARRALTIDPAAVAERAATLAPGRAGKPLVWDRLMLLAAMTLYNPDIATSRAAVAAATANVATARQWPNMTFTLTTEYAHDPSASSPWLLGGALDVPLDIGGRRASRIAAADLGALSARYDFAEATWAARLALRKALTDRFVADRQVAALTDLAGVRDRQYAAMEHRLAAGEASRAELDRVRADGADAARRLGDAETQRRAADYAIAAAIGVPVEAIAGLVPRWDGFDAPAPDPSQNVTVDMRRAALLGRADILKALAAYDQTEAELRGEVAKQFPAISIGPGYTWERGLVKLPFSLGLTLPPLDLNRHAIAAAEARRAEAGKRLEAAVAAAEAAIDAALVETHAARVALAHVRTVELATAQRLAAQADRELAAGAIDRTDWAAAQAGVRQVRTVEIDALARVHAADAALEDALRRPMEGPETMIEQQAMEREAR
jgi:CRISPR system Cascade subunit CasA